jgi:hypothetical protein
MKKITSTFVFTLIAAFLFAGTVEYTYNYSSPAVKDAGNFQTISFENTFLTGIAGEPVMPYQAVKLLLPPGEEAVSVDFAFETENILDGSFSYWSPGNRHNPILLAAMAPFIKKRTYTNQKMHILQVPGENIQRISSTDILISSHHSLLQSISQQPDK